MDLPDRNIVGNKISNINNNSNSQTDYQQTTADFQTSTDNNADNIHQARSNYRC